MSRTAFVSLLAAVVLLSACGPATFTRTRIVQEPYSQAELKQEKEGIVVDLKLGTQFPPSFFANVARCDQFGRILVDQAGNPHMEQLSLARPGQMWNEMAVTNRTDHVVRLNSVALRLFDPSGGQFEPLSREDLAAQLLAERPCGTTQQAVQIFRANKIFDRNIEIVPGTTSSFWIPFRPAANGMTGIWKFSIYEVPVKIDAAGKPIKTTHFEMRIVSKEIKETLRQESFFDKPQLISSTETSPVVSPPAPGGSQPRPAAAELAERSGAAAQSTASSPDATRGSPSGGAPGLAKETIARAQARLRALGFDPGPADGISGNKTKLAIRKFQNSKKLAETGELDAETLKALGVL